MQRIQNDPTIIIIICVGGLFIVTALAEFSWSSTELVGTHPDQRHLVITSKALRNLW